MTRPAMPRAGRNGTLDDLATLVEHLKATLPPGWLLDWTEQSPYGGGPRLAVSPPDGHGGMLLIAVAFRGSGTGRPVRREDFRTETAVCRGCGSPVSVMIDKPEVVQCSNCPRQPEP